MGDYAQDAIDRDIEDDLGGETILRLPRKATSGKNCWCCGGRQTRRYRDSHYRLRWGLCLVCNGTGKEPSDD